MRPLTPETRSAWFVEPLVLAALAVVAIGTALPFSPLAHVLGFQPLPGLFFLALTRLVITYLALIELGKRLFYRFFHAPAKPTHRERTRPPSALPRRPFRHVNPADGRHAPLQARGPALTCRVACTKHDLVLQTGLIEFARGVRAAHVPVPLIDLTPEYPERVRRAGTTSWGEP